MGFQNENNLAYDNFQRDLRYIKTELITKQPNGKYCKYSRPLKAVSIYDFTENEYKGYWSRVYAKSPYLGQILKACDDKLKNHLIELDKMIQLVDSSKDFEKEKIKVLTLLHGGVVKKESNKEDKYVYWKEMFKQTN